MRCCRKHMCGACMTKVLRVDYAKQRFRLSCPFCRRLALVTAKRVKKLMGENCLDHAKMFESEIGPVAVVHIPDPEGRYDSGSSIKMLPLDMPGLIHDLTENVEELREQLAEERATIVRLGESWRDRYHVLPPSSGHISFLGDMLSQSPCPGAGGPQDP